MSINLCEASRDATNEYSNIDEHLEERWVPFYRCKAHRYHMVDAHATTIEDFVYQTLLDADPPRGILDLKEVELGSYLKEHPGKQPVISFKRFIRFLLNTRRINYELGEGMRVLLNQIRSEE